MRKQCITNTLTSMFLRNNDQGQISPSIVCIVCIHRRETKNILPDILGYKEQCLFSQFGSINFQIVNS